MKTILTMVFVAIFATVSFAGDTSVQTAKRFLSQEIGTVMSNDVNKFDNYFYNHDINNIKEDLKVSFYIDENQELVLVRVLTNNLDAKNYVKHFFKNCDLKADAVLKGQTFSIALHLSYRAS